MFLINVYSVVTSHLQDESRVESSHQSSQVTSRVKSRVESLMQRSSHESNRVISVSDRVESVASLESSWVTGLSRVESITKLELSRGIWSSPSHAMGLWWHSRQRNRPSPLGLQVQVPLWTHAWTHVKRVCQRFAESRGFSPGAPISSHRESWHGGFG
jgi:hypothetical protein